MIPERNISEAIEEPETASTECARLSSGPKGERKIIGVLALVLIALVLPVYAFYQAKLVLGRGIWGGFWALTIYIGVWLIVGVVRVLRKTNHETDKRNTSVQDRR
jgi:hypothetical protein